jgi:hypothetical protein
VIVAVLYFAMIELLMIDSSRELSQARLFRARVIAQTLAENGAELAAVQLADPSIASSNVNATDAQGSIMGTMRKSMGGGPGNIQLFTLTGTGQTAGLVKARATVRISGRIVGQSVRIDYTQHSQ